MQKKGLTDKQVKYMPTEETRKVEVPAGPQGLYLVLHPSGRKGWAFRYRYRGRTRNLTFPKPYPEMSLAVARAEAELCIEKLNQDIDPAVVQAEEINQETPESVKAVADEWIKRHVKQKTSERSQDEYERILNKEVLPFWQDKLITEIRKPDVLRVIDGLMDRDAPALANKTLAVVKSWLQWAATDRGYIEANPAASIRMPSKLVSRERVLDPTELVAVWSAASTMGYPTGLYLQFLILTAQRRGEVATMQSTDVDMDKALWTIPGEHTKNGNTHVVPLSKPALNILERLPRFMKGKYLWTTTSGSAAINGFSKMKDRIDRATSTDGWTFHDLRRTASTLMAEAGVLPHILSAVLNHSTHVSVTSMPSAAITKVYNRYAYLDEKRAALEGWAEYLIAISAKSQKQEKA